MSVKTTDFGGGEFYFTGSSGKQSVITAAHYVFAGMNWRAALTHNNHPGLRLLTIVQFDA